MRSLFISILPVLCSLGIVSHFFGYQSMRYPIVVSHPGFEEDETREYYLIQNQGEGDDLPNYFMDVESVICVDSTCKIVPVRIHWNAYGDYREYQLETGVIFEKKGGLPFSPEDYARVHEILQDRNSPYSKLSYYEITHEKVVGEGEVDAITGATAKILDGEKTVQGGAWTCFTLWHWAHGDAVSEIRKLTGSTLSLPALKDLLRSAVPERKDLALQALISRQVYSLDVVDLLVSELLVEEVDPGFYQHAFDLLESLEPPLYFDSMKKLLLSDSRKKRMIAWNSLLRHEAVPPFGYYDNLFRGLHEAENYPELNLFLTAIEKDGMMSRQLLATMLPLLKEDFSIVNRRLYWFLRNQKLSNDQHEVLEWYQAKNEDKL
ncbi:MAG: hypothetical protein KTR24_18505 [Saprospiraceae bacterium]|nr:hypothetical protein [Saprospiraceae bacterium]